jgi:hypothetical protein
MNGMQRSARRAANAEPYWSTTTTRLSKPTFAVITEL